ncbi:hypothetical protein FRB94_008314 [Tulasnella sp. JGI-2019a]|nr:hypothetical protein FRB93_007008 [Tulasnella sp. JGI-2019a]KAG9011483.1 hypothetical protein FRB94_008314 [Tulasnella sp. JGI-2019a]
MSHRMPVNDSTAYWHSYPDSASNDAHATNSDALLHVAASNGMAFAPSSPDPAFNLYAYGTQTQGSVSTKSKEVPLHSDNSQPNTSQPALGLLPALPISSSNSYGSNARALSPPRTPPFLSSPQFSSPVRTRSRSELHPWDTPGSSLPGSPPGSIFPDITHRSPNVGRLPEPPGYLIAQIHSSLPPYQQTLMSSSSLSPLNAPPSTSMLEGSGPAPSFPETEEEFLSNVQRIVEEGDSASAGDERTPSPFIPGTSSSSPPPIIETRLPLHAHSPANPSRLGVPGDTIPPDQNRAVGGELDRLRAQKKEQEAQRQAELDAKRPDYLVRSNPSQERSGRMPPKNAPIVSPPAPTQDEVITSTSLESTSLAHESDVFDAFPLAWAPAPARTTRARDAKEAELAIAAVKALEAASGKTVKAAENHVKGKGNAHTTKRSKSHHSRSRSKDVLNGAEKRDSSADRPPISRATSTAQTSKPSTTPPPSSKALLPTPSTPPRTSLNAGTSRSTITVSPIKGRRIKLIRPSSPSETELQSRSRPTSHNDLGMVGVSSEPVIQWLNSPSPKPARLPKPSRRGTKSQEDRDWSLIDLGALAINVPTGSSRQRSHDAGVMLDLLDYERAVKKRKRMAAFRDDSSSSSADEDVDIGSPSIEEVSKSGSRGASASSSSSRVKRLAGSRSSPRSSPLKAALVEGLGRMAIHPGDVQSPTVVSMTAAENQSASPRKTMFGMGVQEDDDNLMDVGGGPSLTEDIHRKSSSPRMSFNQGTSPPNDTLDQAFIEHGPQWPDFRYPWSANEETRRRRHKRSKIERKEMVEQFLERESDSDTDDGSAEWSAVDGQPGFIEDGVVAGARGLWAMTQDTSESPVARRLTQLFPSEAGTSSVPASLFGPSPAPVAPTDPGDARIALASRRDVRATLYIASRRKEALTGDSDEDEGRVYCICNGADDGRAMVRCDRCKTWSHQFCVGIDDESELGDCWYCVRCLQDNSGGKKTPEVVTSPVLVPAEERADGQTLVDNRRALLGSPTKVMFSSPPMSPPSNSLAHSSSLLRGHPRTPKVRDARKSVGSSGLQPHTPRMWLDGQSSRTPLISSELGYDPDIVVFDPLGTPSRGTKYSLGSFMPAAGTPLGGRIHHRDGIFATPKAPSYYRFPPSSATVIAPAGPGSSASTLHDQGSFNSPPSQHYPMSFQYTDTPVQRSRPVMHGLAPPVSLGSPVSRKGKGVDRSL